MFFDLHKRLGIYVKKNYIKKIVRTKARPRGSVKIFIEEDGIKELVHEDPNLILNLGRAALCHLCSSSLNQANYVIERFALGCGGETEGDEIIEPAITDTGLEDEQYRDDIDSTEYSPAGTEVTFIFTLEKDEGNGYTYNEAGLVMHNTEFFARETFSGIEKTSSKKLIFNWILYF